MYIKKFSFCLADNQHFGQVARLERVQRTETRPIYIRHAHCRLPDRSEYNQSSVVVQTVATQFLDKTRA